MKVYQYYKDLPPWAKGVSVVGVLLITYVVGRRVYKYAFPSQSEKEARKLFDNIENEINKKEEQGMSPTFPDSNYVTFANTIYNGMRYAVGDNYSDVEENMKKMQNDLDVAKLIKAFGIRQDYNFGIPSGNPKDLFTFVKEELGNDWGGITDYRLNRINEDWSKKGITYKI